MNIDKLYEFYVSPNNTKMMKSKSVRWAGYLACIVEGRCVDRLGNTKTSSKEAIWKI